LTLLALAGIGLRHRKVESYLTIWFCYSLVFS
jgi:hypothetical protein